MKRYGNLWERIVEWENLVLAARKAQRGKRDRLAVQRFNFSLEAELLRLQTELVDGSYRPGLFHTHWIVRPKPRLISAAPYRDRVVHLALMNILEPILDRHFHPNSYACRKGKGTHAAADRLQQLMRTNRYALQCDVQKFFPTLDHAVLKNKYRRLIKDKRVLRLMDLIVDCSNEQPGGLQWFDGDDLFVPLERRKGLPIGNLTSQWFANWYLNDLDHFVAKRLGIGGYVRYCDDFILLSNDRNKLVEARTAIKAFLGTDRLLLHRQKLFIRPTQAGLTFVGYRIWPDFRLLRKDNLRNFRRRIRWMQKAYRYGHIEFSDVKQRLNSWMAHASHANSYRTILRVSKDWVFTRAKTNQLSCTPRGQLEQQCQQLPRFQPEQQQPEQPQQQYRVSGVCVALVPALSNEVVRNHRVYGFDECDVESTGHCPELAGIKKSGGQILIRSSSIGRQTADDSVRLFKTIRCAA